MSRFGGICAKGRRGLAMLLLLAAAPAERVSLGQFGPWGAFRDRAPARCYTIVQPISARGEVASPSLMIASWPRLRARDQLHVRFSRIVVGGASIVVGTRRFDLMARGAEGWARSARDDAQIVAVVRGGGAAQIRAIDRRGRRFRDLYPLDGAASAIDAMRLGCLPD